MTIRAFIIGVFFALLIAGFGYVNDWILDLERVTSGHLLPIVVVGPLLLFAATVNVLLFKTRKKWAFTGAELALIFIFTSTACSIPGRNLMEHFTQVLVMPHHWYRVNPGWKDKKLREFYPKEVFVDPEYSDSTVSGFVTGMSDPTDSRLSFWERMRVRSERVPWGAWGTPLKVWLPIIFFGSICYGCLALILHKQWSKHEHLSYPIADFVTSILGRSDKEATTPTLANRVFWLGFVIVFAIRLNNGLCQWFPDYLIPIKLDFRFMPFLKVFPSIRQVQWGTSLLRLSVFPMVIAFAFLLSTEISLTMGVSQILWAIFAIPFIKFGVEFNTDYGMGGWSGWQRGGSSIAFGIMLFYTGRNYYLGLMKDAVTRWQKPDEANSNVWAMRFLAVAGVTLIFLVNRLGLALPFAMGTVFLGLLSCVIVSRISAETGLFFIHPRWQPFGFLIAMLGGYMLNPSALALSVMVCFMFSIDQSQAYLPYLANGLKISEKLKLPKAKISYITIAICGVGMLLAVAVALIATYDRGTPAQCRWSFTFLPKMVFQMIEPEVLRLQATNILNDAETLPWYAKLGSIQAKENFYWAAGFGFFAVLLFSFLRLRLPKWPLHPVLFLVWMTWPMVVFSYSILIGWLVKTLSIRFGGNALVQKLRPFMFGVIGAEIMGALLFMVVGLVYFLITGKPPIAYRYFPR